MKDWVNISQRLIMLGQLGLSLVMPVLICMGACYLLTSRVGLGLWIYFPGLIFGLGASFMTLTNYGSKSSRESGRKARRNLLPLTATTDLS